MSESESHKKGEKLAVLGPLKKAKKFVIRCAKVSRKKNSKPNSSSGKGKFVHCCFCFEQSSTLESSSVESVTSDPNDANFTFGMLRILIENNEFYCKECNPHLDHTCSSYSADDSVGLV